MVVLSERRFQPHDPDAVTTHNMGPCRRLGAYALTLANDAPRLKVYGPLACAVKRLLGWYGLVVATNDGIQIWTLDGEVLATGILGGQKVQGVTVTPSGHMGVTSGKQLDLLDAHDLRQIEVIRGFDFPYGVAPMEVPVSDCIYCYRGRCEVHAERLLVVCDRNEKRVKLVDIESGVTAKTIQFDRPVIRVTTGRTDSNEYRIVVNTKDSIEFMAPSLDSVERSLQLRHPLGVVFMRDKAENGDSRIAIGEHHSNTVEIRDDYGLTTQCCGRDVTGFEPRPATTVRNYLPVDAVERFATEFGGGSGNSTVVNHCARRPKGLDGRPLPEELLVVISTDGVRLVSLESNRGRLVYFIPHRGVNDISAALF